MGQMRRSIHHPSCFKIRSNLHNGWQIKQSHFDNYPHKIFVPMHRPCAINLMPLLAGSNQFGSPNSPFKRGNNVISSMREPFFTLPCFPQIKQAGLVLALGGGGGVLAKQKHHTQTIQHKCIMEAPINPSLHYLSWGLIILPSPPSPPFLIIMATTQPYLHARRKRV